MKQKILRVIVVGILSSTLFIVATSLAYAVSESCSHGYRTFNDRILNGGVGAYGGANRSYWISPSLVSAGYTGYTQQAVSEWVNTSTTPGVTTSISIVQTSVQSSSSFDLYSASLGGGSIGRTRWYLYSTQITDPSAQSWGWTDLYFDCAVHSNNGYSAGTKRGIVAHEFGHAMGLSHQPGLQTTSIMYNYDTRSMYRAAMVDCRAINHIYG